MQTEWSSEITRNARAKVHYWGWKITDCLVNKQLVNKQSEWMISPAQK